MHCSNMKMHTEQNKIILYLFVVVVVVLQRQMNNVCIVVYINRAKLLNIVVFDFSAIFGNSRYKSVWNKWPNMY